LNSSPSVGLAWPSLLAFLRIVTNSRLFSKPWPIEQAWNQITCWREAPGVWHPQETSSHAEILEPYLLAVLGGNSVPDAHLAALATQHGMELLTADRGFARFPGLRWANPINRPQPG